MKIRNWERWLGHSSRDGDKITTIVYHSTAGAGAISSIKYLLKKLLNRNPDDDASYHFLIERDGSIIKTVPIERKAWHAGKSLGPEGPNVNTYSIGIAFANKNDGYEPITRAQIMAALQLTDALVVAYPTIRHLTTHFGISHPRKSDPRLFKLEDFWMQLPSRARLKTFYKPGAPKYTTHP